jgi:hypothetical protein
MRLHNSRGRADQGANQDADHERDSVGWQRAP